MKLPHIVRYKDNKNPIVGGSTKGFFITLGLKFKGNTSVYEHEYEHVRQWYAASGIGLLILFGLYFLIPIYLLSVLVPILSFGLDPILYSTSSKYREWAEIKAYKKQIKAGGDLETAILGLSSPTYDYSITYDQAKKILG